MDYQTFQPYPDLESLVKFHWTLEVPAEADPRKQRILPDGCIEMVFILGDDIRRYTSDDDFVIQPRAMVLGQITEPFFVQPVGYVNSFAVRFYPFGFASFVATPINELADKETPLALVIGEEYASNLELKMAKAENTNERITIIEEFLLSRLKNERTIDAIVKSTIDAMFSTKGSMSISAILEDDLSKRRQLERKFRRQIGMSPKRLGKVIRLQSALKLLLNPQPESLTKIAYESEYYDQAHFIKDFKEFAGTTPGEFLGHNSMALSALFYKGS